MLDFDDRDLFDEIVELGDAASPPSEAADVAPPGDLNVVLADDTADPDDFIFEGINITQTAARSWATEELPDFGMDLPDLWTPGSSTQPESPIATPKDDDPLPGLDPKATGSPHPEDEGIDPRALCGNNTVQLGPPVETRRCSPEQSSVALQHAADVSLAGGTAKSASPLVGGLGAFDALDSFFDDAPTAPTGPPQPIPSAEELNEMMASIFGQPVRETPQAARPMPPNVPMMPPMPTMPPMPPMMPFAAPAFAAGMYPPAYGFPPPFVTPQQMFWMAQASMFAHQQQQPSESGPSRRKQARPRPAPYKTDQNAQQGSHAGLYDGWRHPQPGVKRSDDRAESAHRGRKCTPKNALRVGNMGNWPPGMPLPGVAPPAGQA